MSRTIALAAALLLSSTALALAHSNAARLDEQAGMIEDGRRSGEITWLEGRKLRKEQREIARVKAIFEADGKLTREEKRVLFRMQDQAGEHIEAEATDRWHRVIWLPRIGR